MVLSTLEHRSRLNLDAEISKEARVLIKQHGKNAVYVALDQLNVSIDHGDICARDFWVQVVRSIHECQRPTSL